MPKLTRVVLSLTCIFGLTHCGAEDDPLIDALALEYTSADEIVNGVRASADLVARHGFLVGPQGNGRANVCGATYIGKTPEENRPTEKHWVLTAAHCVDESEIDYFVAFGKARRSEYTSSDFVAVDEVVIAPGWAPAVNLRNDIALLRLSKKPNATVSRIATPKTDTFVGERLVVSGFGKTSSGNSGTISDLLLKADTRRVRSSVCDRVFIGELSNTQLCIFDGPDGSGGSNKSNGSNNSNSPDNVNSSSNSDESNNSNNSNGSNNSNSSNSSRQSICNGDSGGPAYRPNLIQVGISSFTAGNCPTNRPQGMTRVAGFRGWIKRVSGI